MTGGFVPLEFMYRYAAPADRQSDRHADDALIIIVLLPPPMPPPMPIPPMPMPPPIPIILYDIGYNTRREKKMTYY
jgi:hypothetical protein